MKDTWNIIFIAIGVITFTTLLIINEFNYISIGGIIIICIGFYGLFTG